MRDGAHPEHRITPHLMERMAVQCLQADVSSIWSGWPKARLVRAVWLVLGMAEDQGLLAWAFSQAHVSTWLLVLSWI